MVGARFAVASVTLAWVAACGLALDGMESGSGSDGGAQSPGDATSPGDGSAEGRGDDDSGHDVGVLEDVVVAEAQATDSCTTTSSTEDCTNGIDDNCNGYTDCADPDCASQNYVCLDPAPSGWDVAPLDPSGQPGCPPDLKASSGLVDPDLNETYSCGCSCGQNEDPSCVTGTLTVAYGTDATCSVGTATFPASDGGCNAMDLQVAGYGRATPLQASGGSCLPSASSSIPSVGGSHGQFCSGEMQFGAGCSGGQICGHVPGGFKTCIRHGGENATCPSGSPYSQAHTIGALDDTRGCSSCTCAPPSATCGSGTLTFYPSAGCSGEGSVTQAVDGQCDPLSGDTIVQSYQYSASPSNIECATPQQPQPTGSAKLTDPDTLCCE